MHFHRHCQFVRRPSLYFENFEKFSPETRPSQAIKKEMDGIIGILEHLRWPTATEELRSRGLRRHTEHTGTQ